MQPMRLDLLCRSDQTAAENLRVQQPGPALLKPAAWILELQFGEIRLPNSCRSWRGLMYLRS